VAYLAPEKGGLEAKGGQIWDMWAPLCRAATGGSDSVWASWPISGEGDLLLLWWGLFGGDRRSGVVVGPESVTTGTKEDEG
jgi:hypothetical protein